MTFCSCAAGASGAGATDGLVTARGNGEAFIVARSGPAIDSVRVTVADAASGAPVSCQYRTRFCLSSR